MPDFASPPSGITARQRMVLDYLVSEDGEACEGYAFDALYYDNPQIKFRGMRVVIRALVDKGLAQLVEWEDDHAGYLIRITDAGRKAVEA